MRDLYYRQELNKMRISTDKWLCKYCNKTFLSEYYLDLHLVNRHNSTLLQVCECLLSRHINEHLSTFPSLSVSRMSKPFVWLIIVRFFDATF